MEVTLKVLASLKVKLSPVLLRDLKVVQLKYCVFVVVRIHAWGQGPRADVDLGATLLPDGPAGALGDVSFGLLQIIAFHKWA